MIEIPKYTFCQTEDGQFSFDSIRLTDQVQTQENTCNDNDVSRKIFTNKWLSYIWFIIHNCD